VPEQIDETQYLVIKGQNLYTIRCTASAAHAAELTPAFDQIVQALQLI